MKFVSAFKSFLTSNDNSTIVTYQFCRLLGIKVTIFHLRNLLESHPDYPSLLAISDTLNSLEIENVAGQINFKDINQLPRPFIAHVKINDDDYFTVVSSIDDNLIAFYNPIEGEDNVWSIDKFRSVFLGSFLVADKSDFSGERNYQKNLREEKRTQIIKNLIVLSIPIFTVVLSIYCGLKYGIESFYSIIYVFLALIGAITGVLLLWYDIDKYNPTLQKICSGGQKTNCDAILNSERSKIWGISWSAIGFVYFTGILFGLLTSGIYNRSVLFLFSWLNIIVLPYIFFSLYYQYKIAKQWCVLCLTVQALLVLQATIGLLGNYPTALHYFLKQPTAFFTALFSFLVPSISVAIILPALRLKKENKQITGELQKLKHNPQIFETVLTQQLAITESTEGMGIVLGNPRAVHKLIKVCSPYCGPCSEAHLEIETLIKNNDNLQVQIIFSTKPNDFEYKKVITRHLLAIAEKRRIQDCELAINDWYQAKNKDYKTFAEKYPLDFNIQIQDDKINRMGNWCDSMKVSGTPTFFINGYKLPRMYSITDLQYYLAAKNHLN